MVQKIFRAFGTINSIIRTQSLDVVAVSGATFSGNGILEAALYSRTVTADGVPAHRRLPNTQTL